MERLRGLETRSKPKQLESRFLNTLAVIRDLDMVRFMAGPPQPTSKSCQRNQKNCAHGPTEAV